MDRILPHLFLLVAVLGLLAGFLLPSIGSEVVDVPPWIIKNIARVETSSSWSPDPACTHYVDRRDGAAGEVGMFQMRRIAFEQVGLLSLRSEARRDPVCAEFCAVVYLRWCRRQAGSWLGAIALYHTGPGGDPDEGRDYVLRVQGRQRVE